MGEGVGFHPAERVSTTTRTEAARGAPQPQTAANVSSSPLIRPRQEPGDEQERTKQEDRQEEQLNDVDENENNEERDDESKEMTIREQKERK